MTELELVFDNYYEIAKHIENGSDWKNWIFVCKAFAGMNTQSRIDRYSNHLTTLLKLFPDKSWNWNHMSDNPNITWQIIQDNPTRRWNWSSISRNPSITWQTVCQTGTSLNDNP